MSGYNPTAHRKYQVKRRLQYRSMMNAMKDRPCFDCGRRFPPVCMDWDHVRGEKLFDISKGLARSAADVAAELSKCELVCSNCHRIRTHSRL